MNQALSWFAAVGFLALPFAVEWALMRAPLRVLLPLYALLAVAVGWGLYLGFVHFHHLAICEPVMNTWSPDPAALIRCTSGDGARLVFALYYGWVPALLYLGSVALLRGAWFYLRSLRRGRSHAA